MNRPFLGLIVGLLIGTGATWLLLRYSGGAEPAKAEAVATTAEKPKENPLKVPPAKRAAIGLTLAKPTEATLVPEEQAFGRVLDARWIGAMNNGVRAYTVEAFHAAFAMIAIWSLVSCLLIAFTKETRCRQAV